MADSSLVMVLASIAVGSDETCQDNLAFDGNVPDGDSIMSLASVSHEILATLRPEIVGLFRTLWAHPELPGLEVEAQRHLTGFLAKHGFTIHARAGDIPTAFIARWKNGAGPRIAFLAEYDALPGLANSASARRDPPSTASGHACGHNHIGPVACGAAITAALSAQRLGLKGEIAVIGCPAEEILWGKIALLHRGVFADHDVVFAAHGDYQTGAIARPCMAVANGEFIFLGKAGHGGLAGRHNALDGAEAVIAEVARRAKTDWSDCSVKHVLRSAGIMPSITPDEVRLWLTVRHVDMNRVSEVYRSIEEICRGTTVDLGLGFRHQHISETRGYLANHVLGRLLQKAMDRVGPPKWDADDLDFMSELAKACGGGPELALDRATKLYDQGQDYYGQDDGEVSWHIPLGRVNWACPRDVPIHHWGWTALSGHKAGDAGPLMAAEALACAAGDVLADPSLAAQAKAERDEEVRGLRLDLPRLGAWKTICENPRSFWNATWVE